MNTSRWVLVNIGSSFLTTCVRRVRGDSGQHSVSAAAGSMPPLRQLEQVGTHAVCSGATRPRLEGTRTLANDTA